MNSPVLLERKVPVHLTYFTTVVDDTGNVTSFADIYGADKKLAMALLQHNSACSIWTRNEETETEAMHQHASVNPGRAEIVAATWHGDEFRGSRTASGEVFNPEGLTAAHRSLPFGTCLMVGNPQTGKSTVVRVNDRGPFTEGMSLDLSAGAARAIGMRSTQKVSMKRC